jgi:hypothetical protein
MNDSWDWLWRSGLLGATAFFFIVELTAIFTHHSERTFTRNLQSWLGIRPQKPWRKIAGALFSTLLAGGVELLIWHLYS